MEKKAKLVRYCSVRTSVEDRGVRKERTQRIPSALSTQASPKSEASVLFDMTTKSAKKWWLNRQRRWAIFYDAPFTALELSALKPW